ncbi:MAG TPA: response regulator transcription factor [Candidatus Blautia avistercoris]|nr:response regulator transcription factor [Candidatus Blautia avistercoris]
MAPKILVADDEIEIRNMLKRYFTLDGYDVITAAGGQDARNKLSLQPDIILLDINMPDIDGLSLCKSIRDFISCPILFLTANVEDSDKIKGFGAGGDDYIVKPFSIDELGARVSAHLRRESRSKVKARVLFNDCLAVDYTERAAYWNGQEIPLLKKEFDIIEVLSQNPGQVFDKERLYEAAWGLDGMGNNSVVAEHIRKIRAKFAAIGAKQYIETVWGVGYKWQK